MKRPASTAMVADSNSGKARCRSDVDLDRVPHLVRAGLAGETAEDVARKLMLWRPEPAAYTHGLVAEVREMFKGSTVLKTFIKCLLTSLEIAEEKQDRALLTRVQLAMARAVGDSSSGDDRWSYLARLQSDPSLFTPRSGLEELSKRFTRQAAEAAKHGGQACQHRGCSFSGDLRMCQGCLAASYPREAKWRPLRSSGGPLKPSGGPPRTKGGSLRQCGAPPRLMVGPRCQMEAA